MSNAIKRRKAGQRLRARKRLDEWAAKAHETLDLYDKELAYKPNRISPYCEFCGRPAQSKHHVIPRSRLGKVADKVSPLFSVCGWGNSDGCHGKLHTGRLFVRWNDGYECLESDVPISRDMAHSMDGWEILGGNNGIR